MTTEKTITTVTAEKARAIAIVHVTLCCLIGADPHEIGRITDRVHRTLLAEGIDRAKEFGDEEVTAAVAPLLAESTLRAELMRVRMELDTTRRTLTDVAGALGEIAWAHIQHDGERLGRLLDTVVRERCQVIDARSAGGQVH